MGDPDLYWTLFVALALNVIVVAFAIINARR